MTTRTLLPLLLLASACNASSPGEPASSRQLPARTDTGSQAAATAPAPMSEEPAPEEPAAGQSAAGQTEAKKAAIQQAAIQPASPAPAPASSAPQDSADDTLQDLGTALSRELLRRSEQLGLGGQPLRVGVGELGYGDEEIPTPFTRRLAQELSLALGSCPLLQEVERARIDGVLDELKLSISDLHDTGAGDVPEFGKLAVVSALLHASYRLEEDRVVVVLELVDVETAVKRFVARVQAALPAAQRREVRPAGLEQIESTLAALSERPAEPDFSTSLWTSRSMLRTGDPLQINFRSEEDCYVKLYHVDAEGSIQLVYPCQDIQLGRVAAGQVLTLPSAGDSYTAAPPLGTDVLFAIASSEPFTRDQPCGTPLGSRPQVRQVRTRGLKVQSGASAATPPRRGYARTTYTTTD